MLREIEQGDGSQDVRDEMRASTSEAQHGMTRAHYHYTRLACDEVEMPLPGEGHARP